MASGSATQSTNAVACLCALLRRSEAVQVSSAAVADEVVEEKLHVVKEHQRRRVVLRTACRCLRDGLVERLARAS